MIHLLPLTGVAGGARLGALYGVSVRDPNLAVLLRHRAVLFGLLGALLVGAAFVPSLRTVSIIGGAVSAVSLLVIARSENAVNVRLQRVVRADLVALACLIAAAVLYALA